MPYITFAIFLIIAYLVGSLNSAIIVSKVMQLPDPRKEGSKNPGATNILRVGGKHAAAIVLLGDVLKGFVPVILANWFGLVGIPLGLVALAAVMGHIYPVFFGFNGGKGVATTFGVVFAMSFWLGIVFSIVWLAIGIVTRYASLASICAVIIISVTSPFLTGYLGYFVPLSVIALLVVWKHRENIIRLKNGTERKVNLRKRI